MSTTSSASSTPVAPSSATMLLKPLSSSSSSDDDDVQDIEYIQSIKYTPDAEGSILITGGAGFIASHVVDLIAKTLPNQRIVVLDKLDYCASLDNIQGALDAGSISPNVTFVHGDVCSTNLVSMILDTEKVDTIMHFAAQTHVDSSFGNSLSFTMNNTLGTHCLLEAARLSSGIRRFIYVSTDEVYGETSVGLSIGLTEQCRLEPTNPYSAAKAGAEMMCSAYATSYGMPMIITRGNNVYGPRQFPEKLIPKLIINANRGGALPIHGDGMAVRSYLHVQDVADAFYKILRFGEDGKTYNIGAVKERTVLEVANDVRDCVVKIREEQHATTSDKSDKSNKRLNLAKASHLSHVQDRAFNDRRYFIGCEQLHNLGWKEQVTWEDGLRDTVQWYLDLVDSSADSDSGDEDAWQKRWPRGDVEAALKPHMG